MKSDCDDAPPRLKASKGGGERSRHPNGKTSDKISTSALPPLASKITMNRARAAVTASYLLSIGIIGRALFSTDLMQGEATQPGTLIAFAIFSLACGWPWLMAYLRTRSAATPASVWVFSFVSPFFCSFFADLIADSPAEGVGYQIIFCVLTVWLSYPLSRWLSDR